MDYKSKYLKYKNKYIQLKNKNDKQEQVGGTKCMDYGFQQHTGECWHDALAMIFLQSDLIKDKFIDNIRTFNLDIIKIKFTEIFSEKNIEANLKLLPKLVQEFYNTKVKANKNEIDKIYKILDYCYAYCLNFQKRAVRRLDFDKDIQRYDIKEFQLYDQEANKEFIEKTKDEIRSRLDPDLPEDIKQKRIKEELKDIIAKANKRVQDYNRSTKLTKQEKIIKLKRRDSFTEARMCPTEIMKIFALLNVQKDDDYYYSNPYRRGGNTRTVELVMDILELFFLNNINLNMIIADVDEKDFFTKLNEIINNPNLIGIHISLVNKKSERHAISVYKCDTTELLYDDNLYKPYPFEWSGFFKDVIKQNDANIFFLEDDYYTRKYGFVFEKDVDRIIYREALDYKLVNLDKLVINYNDIKQDYLDKKISLDATEEKLSTLYSKPFNEIKNNEEDIVEIYKIVIVRGIVLLKN
jgi:hypothetical protein